MKYLRHKVKGCLTPYNPSIESAEWEVYEEPGPHDPPAQTPEVIPPKVERKKPGPKPKHQEVANGADRS